MRIAGGAFESCTWLRAMQAPLKMRERWEAEEAVAAAAATGKKAPTSMRMVLLLLLLLACCGGVNGKYLFSGWSSFGPSKITR